jgi:hypothetical protein
VQAVERRVAGGPARDSVRRAVADARTRWHEFVAAKP